MKKEDEFPNGMAKFYDEEELGWCHDNIMCYTYVYTVFIISQDGGETEEETGLEETHQHVHKEKVEIIYNEL